MKDVRQGKRLRGVAERTIRRAKQFIFGKYALDDAYDENFFLFNLADSRPQAEWLAPRLAKALSINSVVDLGCATGHWVAAFLRCGVDARGIEGASAAARYLVCPADRVIFADLRQPLAEPARKVDFLLSIEVAEHIEEKYVDIFLANMVRYNPRIIFMTGAPPGQGGHFHVNEQPHAYWIDRLKERGYKYDQSLKDMVSEFVLEGRRLKDVPPIMQRSDLRHDGVWIPEWMPKNLMVFRN